MTTRYWAEEPCEHGEMLEHRDVGTYDDTACPGGVRRELTIDYEAAVTRAVPLLVVAADRFGSEHWESGVGLIRKAVDAALGDPR